MGPPPSLSLSRRRAPALLLVLLSVFATAGCSHYSGLLFHVDNRLHITSPKNESTLHGQNVTISWTMQDFTPAAQGSGPATTHAGYFALFLDQSAVRPGKTMAKKDPDGPTCGSARVCPSEADLNLLSIYTTTKLSYTIQDIPSGGSNAGSYDEHTLIIVLMNTAGRRIGESAWEVDFKTPKVDV